MEICLDVLGNYGACTPAESASLQFSFHLAFPNATKMDQNPKTMCGSDTSAQFIDCITSTTVVVVYAMVKPMTYDVLTVFV